MIRSILLATLLFSAPPVEVGTVAWGRDFDAALAESSRTGKPVFAFFQEVPGCAGCRDFGREVMSDPWIAQAVEREFVPVLIYNNRGGRDRELLLRYDEPAWNYQVVRFLDGEGRDLIPRRDRVWTKEPLARRMIRALETSGRDVPAYLEIAAYEGDEPRIDRIAFAQSCFWTGESELGKIVGVVGTEAGWLEGREVTLVRYHRDLLSRDDLIAAARRAGVADQVYLPGRVLDRSYRRAPESDQKRRLSGSIFDVEGLTPMQRAKVNAFLAVDGEAALDWLTPAQRRDLAAAAGR